MSKKKENISEVNWLEKRGKVRSGAMVGIHTFGARINFNPHVHILVTEGGFNGAGKWVVKEYIPYVMLRKRWQATVMDMDIERHENFSKILPGC